MILSNAAWVVLVLHILAITWVVVIDELITVNKWYEKYFWSYLPKVLKSGASWTTWIAHGFVAVLMMIYFALWALIFSESLVGAARLGSAVVLVFYAIREFMDWRHHARNKDPDKWSIPNGWGFDGFMDTVAPVAIHLWTWTL